jgi:dolichyl-phosphate beta-glucosyltransferase
LNQAVPDFSIVIPCRNEAKRVPPTLRSVLRFLDGWEHPTEVVVVDENSPDGTADLVRNEFSSDSRIRVLSNPVHLGKGHAVTCGMLEAGGSRARVFMDADLSVPARFLRGMLERLSDDEGPQICIGSRHLPESSIPIPQPLSRRIAGGVFRRAVRWSGLSRLRDTQCGFKGFRTEVVPFLFRDREIQGFLFDLEILLRAGRAGLSIEEMPVEWNHQDHSTLGPVRQTPKLALEFFRLLVLRYRPETSRSAGCMPCR